MERELLLRDPLAKLMRRDDELIEIERQLQEASERLDMRHSFLGSQGTNSKRMIKLNQLHEVERLGGLVNDLKQRRNKWFIEFNELCPAAVAQARFRKHKRLSNVH